MFGLKTLPSGFAAFVGGTLGSSNAKGRKKWSDDITIYQVNPKRGRQVDALRQVLDKRSIAGLSVHFSKSWWCCP